MTNINIDKPKTNIFFFFALTKFSTGNSNYNIFKDLLILHTVCYKEINTNISAVVNILSY